MNGSILETESDGAEVDAAWWCLCVKGKSESKRPRCAFVCSHTRNANAHSGLIDPRAARRVVCTKEGGHRLCGKCDYTFLLIKYIKHLC